MSRVQPSEAPDQPSEAKVIELHGERGSLTLRPNQTVLDENQKAALVAIGIDVKQDPMVVPHLRGFIHMCQAKGLDPWAREAYLIGRGRGDNRKYTMQTGIDGYRKIANMTGRFIRVADVLWTGRDDDDRSYYRDERGVMRRVWYDQWPASRGFPGAAKVIIEHYDDANNVVTTEAVADWAMYAPFSDKYEGYGNSRKKVMDPDNPGRAVQVLNDMWAKGYAHMLAKCAEALAHRKAFPASMSGVYTHEEMHRADQQERDRIEAEVTRARREAYAAATEGTSAPILATPEAPADAEEPSGPMPITEPVQVGDVAAEVVEGMRPEPAPDVVDDATKVEWLREELDWQAGVFDVPPLGSRPGRSRRCARTSRTSPSPNGAPWSPGCGPRSWRRCEARTAPTTSTSTPRSARRTSSTSPTCSRSTARSWTTPPWTPTPSSPTCSWTTVRAPAACAVSPPNVRRRPAAPARMSVAARNVRRAREIFESLPYGPRTHPCVCRAGIHEHSGASRTGGCKRTGCKRYRADAAYALAYAALDAAHTSLGHSLRAADAARASPALHPQPPQARRVVDRRLGHLDVPEEDRVPQQAAGGLRARTGGQA